MSHVRDNVVPFQHYRGSSQLVWPFDDLIVDSFCGGGGASTGIEMALGRQVDYAINHNPDAISMHEVNHPRTKHFNESVWDINPKDIAAGQQVSLAWFSPDCTHHSKAKGGKPVKKSIRGLAWVVLKWAVHVKPLKIMMENVEEMLTWCNVDANGKPIGSEKGDTFKRFVRKLEKCGYAVEYRVLRCSDYGVPTSRKRLFLIARCDGLPIVWPKPTHGAPGSGLKPFIPASSIIDWSLECPSIFTRKRPLADKTLLRIAKGLDKYVINSAHPFIVPNTRTLHWVKDLPDQDLVTAFIGRHKFMNEGQDIQLPLPTITSGCGSKRPAGAAHSLALHTSHLVKFRGTEFAADITRPLPTVTAGGNHIGEVRAFLLKYYGSKKDGCDLNNPLDTVTTRERFGLVVVKGELYQIRDIGMRMLQPHELYRAHGFPADYQIQFDKSGNPFPKSKQVAMVGNSVPPLMVKCLVEANSQDRSAEESMRNTRSLLRHR